MIQLESFIQNIINTPYVWWREGDEIGLDAPFWAENTEIPSIELIKQNGCNCAGFINLISRYIKLEIPGVLQNDEWAGGSWYWFQFLKNTGQLEEYNPEITYPERTLILRNYSSPEDQGHLGIILSGNRIAHCYPKKGIQIDTSIQISHNWISEGYYTHISKFLINNNISN